MTAPDSYDFTCKPIVPIWNCYNWYPYMTIVESAKDLFQNRLFFYTCLGYLSWRPLIRCLPRYLLRPAFATIKKSKIKFILIKWFYFSRFILLIVYFTIQKLKVKRLDASPRPKSILFEEIYHFYLHSPHFEFKIMVPPLQDSSSNSEFKSLSQSEIFCTVFDPTKQLFFQ